MFRQCCKRVYNVKTIMVLTSLCTCVVAIYEGGGGVEGKIVKSYNPIECKSCILETIDVVWHDQMTTTTTTKKTIMSRYVSIVFNSRYVFDIGQSVHHK